MSKISSLIQANSIIVSCQAESGTPTDSDAMIVAFAQSAVMGRASGLRLAGSAHIAAVRSAGIQLPIIGIHKRNQPGELVLITGDVRDVRPLVDAGARIVAFDSTPRNRPSPIPALVAEIHACGALALADLRRLSDADEALAAGADALATTLSVWDRPDYVPDIVLIEQLTRLSSSPVIAEGNFWTRADVRRAFDAGAHAVVVGSAITRPWKIVEYFVGGVPGEPG